MCLPHGVLRPMKPVKHQSSCENGERGRERRTGLRSCTRRRREAHPWRLDRISIMSQHKAHAQRGDKRPKSKEEVKT